MIVCCPIKMVLPLLCLLMCAAGFSASGATRPNIVVIIADDLGWNDVGFHGMNHIPTPNIDALAYSGVILQNHYVTPICTPSRAAFMTGKYPIHNGMQHTVLFALEPRGLPLSEKLLPEYLQELGYKTHLVGKWHLGFHKKEYLPMNRGFDSHLGFWSGRIDHFDHTSMENGTWGFDFRRGIETAQDLFNQYVTDIFADEAVKIIREHNKADPLFLTVAHSAMHSGNPNDPIRAPYRLVDNFTHIHGQRRKYAAVLSKLDESVGKVVEALQEKGLLDNTIILFTTDNGGAPEGFNDNAGSNYPLRGVKNTLWEGGVRGAGFLWSPLIKKKSRVATQTMHITDWLPTLFHAVGGDLELFKNIDGINVWEALSRDLPSPRHVVVYNIDDIWGSASLTIDQWKVHKGSNYKSTWDGWYGPDGREGGYSIDSVFSAAAGQTLKRAGWMPSKDTILKIRKEATIVCNESLPLVPCFPLKSECLFNIEADPCERQNLASEYPEVLSMMLSQLRDVNRTAVAPANVALDERGDPKYWGRVYTTFADYERKTCS